MEQDNNYRLPPKKQWVVGIGLVLSFVSVVAPAFSMEEQPALEKNATIFPTAGPSDLRDYNLSRQPR